MKKSLASAALLAAGMMVFTGCEQNDQFVELAQSAEILVPSTARAVDLRSLRESVVPAVAEAEEFAKLLAVSLADLEMRKFLKNEANKKFDGDYDILVSKVLNEKVGNGKFSEKVKIASKLGISAGNEVVGKAVRNPLLNISIPVLIEKWNETGQMPLVAVAVGANESGTLQLRAFDSNGKAYLLDAKREPDVAVIVIANNERVSGIQAAAQPAKLSNGKSGRMSATRVSGYYERLIYIKCPDLNAIESWYFGGPELKFEGVVFNNYANEAGRIFTTYQYPSRNSAKDGYTLNQYLFAWYFDNAHGPDYHIESYELDETGSTQNFTVTVSKGVKTAVTGSVDFTLDHLSQDRRLTGQSIDYKNQVPQSFNSQYIEFKLEQ